MSAAAPIKRFTTSCSRRNAYVLFCALILLVSAIPVAGQELPPLLLSKDLSSERPIPQLTPLGRTSVNRPFTVPLEALPRLEQPVIAPIKQEDLDLLIQKGQALEAEARWTEALAHYELALRTHRNETALLDHYRVARFHCDLGRRFHDSSYLKLVQTLSVIETLNFYEEVITKIQQEYADSPRWEPLFQHGIQNFIIALPDTNFRSKVNLDVSDERINAYLSAVQTTVNGWTIRDREDMRNGLLHIAEGAQKQLGLNPAVVILEFTCGVVNSLDPNTAFLTPNQLNDQLSEIYGNLVGVGVELRSDGDALLITRVIPGSPAEESGLKANDHIVAVDGTSTSGRDTNSAADLIPGKEGTPVKLTILSEGFGQRPREISIIRRYIEVPSVEDVRMINNTLGYIKLTKFQKKTVSELTKALNDLDRKGMKCLVLDLRQNPGGSLDAGIDVASMFIDQGAIVRTQGRDRSLDTPCMATGMTRHTPLIVLIDEDSASAAEIVAGAIRDHERGILIGRRTYGKGTIQKIIPVQTGGVRNVHSGIKLTTEKFYSPKGWAYSGVGVTPHEIVPVAEKQRTMLARPMEGRLPSLPQLLRPAPSSLDDPFIQKAVEVSKTL